MENSSEYIEYSVSSSDSEEENVDVACETRRLEAEINGLRAELEKCQKARRKIDLEICKAELVKTDVSLELEYARLRNSDLPEHLKGLRESFEKINKDEELEETATGKIEELTAVRSGLESELAELRKIAEEDRRSLIETKGMIARRKKLNMALLRKVKRGLEDRGISQELREKGNALLNDPRIHGATSTIFRDEK